MNRNHAYRRADDMPADLGRDLDAGILAAKSKLVLKLNAMIASRGLTEEETAALAEMAAPTVTPEQRARLRNVSLEQLLLTLVSFGQQVEIVVRHAGHSQSAGVTVSG
ncbi:XRE family transcriptional regulator [Burkholderia anthina]|uniref:XRE family transcriptional regulator n=1 Tax=Burkholderia anthina TaxID=179879 RepID=UPI001AA07C3F|nr:XRE family transcriptional regulator [Burkholderia anthina]QTD93175.1 XRE family transcriptional regulator [Burkholderia anthina]